MSANDTYNGEASLANFVAGGGDLFINPQTLRTRLLPGFNGLINNTQFKRAPFPNKIIESPLDSMLNYQFLI